MKIFRLLFVSIALLGFSSCNKWLDVTPENEVPDSELFSTGYGFRNALNGVYINLASQGLYGRELSWGFVSAISQQYNQTTGMGKSPLYPDAAELLYKTTETNKIVKNIWEKSYTAIANLNKIIFFIQKANPDIFAYKQNEIDMIYGEALALRAMIHFDLLRLFAPAPSTNPSETYLPYRDSYGPHVAGKLSVNEFLVRVIADLEAAKEKLYRFDIQYHPKALYAYGMPEGNRTSRWNARYRLASSFPDEMGIFFWNRGTRINYMGLLGIMARTYFYAGNSDLAEKYAKELYQDYFEQNKWIGFTTPDLLTAGQNTRASKAIDDALFCLYYKNLASDYYTTSFSESTSSTKTRLPLANIPALFAADNTQIYGDYRIQYMVGKSNQEDPQYYSLKYDRSIDPEITQMENPMIVVMRFSEVCHILAEICADKGQISQGITYLETVRRARGAERSLSLSVTTKEELMDEIIRDARKEFLGEGQTFFLYKRLNIASVENSSGLGSLTLRGKYVLPIPDSEIAF